MGATGAALAVGAVLLGSRELGILAAAAAVALAFGSLIAAYNPRVQFSRRFDHDRMTVGDPCTGTLLAEHQGILPSPPRRVVQRMAGDEEVVLMPGLRPGATCEIAFDLQTSQRGVFELPPISVSRGDPFRLIQRVDRHGEAAVVRVLPRTLPASLPSAGRLLDFDGPTTDFSPPGSATFQSIREYERGDDLRLVHWRSTAKTGTLMVRQHVDLPQPGLTIAVDARTQSWSASAFEQAVVVVASVATSVMRAGFHCGFHSSGGPSFASRGGELAGRRLLDELAGLMPHDGDDLSDLPGRLLATRGPVLFLSGQEPAGLATELAAGQWSAGSAVGGIMGEATAGHSRHRDLMFLKAPSAEEFISLWNRVAVL